MATNKKKPDSARTLGKKEAPIHARKVAAMHHTPAPFAGPAESFKSSETRVPRVINSKSKVADLTDFSDRNSVKVYLQQISKTPLLTIAEENELAAKIKVGDKLAKNKMIQANLRLVVKIAHDYSHYGLPLLDLISEGNIGLVKAVDRFDPSKGGKLSTYAAWWIKQSIKRALANQSKTIRLPVHLIEKISRIRKATMMLQEKLGREPTNEEVAEVIQMSVNKIAHIKAISVKPTSLDMPIGDDEKTNLSEIIGDENASIPFENLESRSRINVVRKVMSKMSKRDASIISMRYGLAGDEPRTLEEVGDHFGITRERVRQLQNTILKEIKAIIDDNERQRTVEEIEEEGRERETMSILKKIEMSSPESPPDDSPLKKQKKPRSRSKKKAE